MCGFLEGFLLCVQGMLRQPIPAFLHFAMQRVDQLGLLSSPTNHVLVNEYQPGQGIMPHTDGPLYAPTIATISLQSHTIIDFYHAQGESAHCSLLLLPRSLFLVQGALYQDLHGIAEATADTLSPAIANLSLCPDLHTYCRASHQPLSLDNPPTPAALPTTDTSISTMSTQAAASPTPTPTSLSTQPLPSSTLAGLPRVLQRGTRISLTIRHVPKARRTPLLLGQARR